MPTPVILVFGAGYASGSAVARRFAREGFIVCVYWWAAEKLLPLIGEKEAAGGKCRPLGVDALKEEAVIAMVNTIKRKVGTIKVFIFNIGGNVCFPVREITARIYFKAWEMAAFGSFLSGREVAKAMVLRGCGMMIFTSATASVNGRAGFSTFAGAKHALSALAQSTVRELGPEGVHVAHMIIDGAIDTALIHDNFPERYLKDRSGILHPHSITQHDWQMHLQTRDAWPHEFDLRP